MHITTIFQIVYIEKKKETIHIPCVPQKMRLGYWNFCRINTSFSKTKYHILGDTRYYEFHYHNNIHETRTLKL